MAARLAGRTTAGAIALLVAVLSGCSEERPASGSLPSPTAETTSSEALPPLGPPDFPVPEAARQKTPEGAVEFTRYYIDLIAFIANGDLNPQPMLDLSSNCSHCERVADTFTSDRLAGYVYSPVSVSFHEYGPGVLDQDNAEVGFVYAQSALTVFDAEGRVVEAESAAPTGDLQSGALLSWRDDLQCWVTTSMTIG